MAVDDIQFLAVFCMGIFALMLPLIGDVHPILAKIAGWEYDLIYWIIHHIPGR